MILQGGKLFKVLPIVVATIHEQLLMDRVSLKPVDGARVSKTQRKLLPRKVHELFYTHGKVESEDSVSLTEKG